jgi:nitroreductase
MDLLNAIYGRRSVRDYTATPVERHVIDDLLRAAVQAPSAVNHQPWAFAVIQDRGVLDIISVQAKRAMLDILGDKPNLTEQRFARDLLRDPTFDIFYNASTLILICSKPGGPSHIEDCCLAAQNLMLAAHAAGLGTCPIGFALPWLNTEQAKRELGIPADYAVVLPLTIGYPAARPDITPRQDPAVVSWIHPVLALRQ